MKSLWLRLHSGTFESNIEAVPDLERATALFEELDDDIGLAECWILRGSIDFWSGDARAAVVAAGHALVHARRAGDSRREVDALRLRTFWQLWGATPIREALEGVGELSRTPAAANPMLRSFIFRSRGMMEAMVGNIGQAHDLIDRSKASASELGLEVDRASALVTAGYVSMLEGDHATAESEYAQAVDLFRAMGDLGHLSSYGPALADEVSAQGRYGEALALTEEGERAAIEGDMDAQVHWRRVRAKAWARLGKSDEAVGLATEAADLARTTDDLDKLGRTLMDLAEVLLLAGRPEDALATANEAVEAFDRKGNVMLASAARELSRACGNAV